MSTRTKLVGASVLLAAGLVWSAIYPEWLYPGTNGRMQRWYESHDSAGVRFWREDFKHCTEWSRARKDARQLLGGNWGYVADQMWLSDMRECLHTRHWTDASILELDTKRELGGDPTQKVSQPTSAWWLVVTWPPGSLNQKDDKPSDLFEELYNTRPECERAAIRASASEQTAFFKEHGGVQLAYRCEQLDKRQSSDTVDPRGPKGK